MGEVSGDSPLALPGCVAQGDGTTRSARRGGLTGKQARFVEEYLVDLNSTAAARRAGYYVNRSHSTVARLMKNEKIDAAIREAQRERSERTGITADRVLEELARIGFSDMRRFVRWGESGVSLIESAELDEDAARCVAEVSQTARKDGAVKFKLHDKVGALTQIGRHLGIFTDKVDATSGGKPIVTIYLPDNGRDGVRAAE